jgi:peptidoglycan hydrolase CwlO-like protein
MTKQEKIKSIAKKLAECRKELEDIRDDISTSEWKKVRSDISSSISFLNKADRDITELTPMEGQMNLFDYLTEDGEFELE